MTTIYYTLAGLRAALHEALAHARRYDSELREARRVAALPKAKVSFILAVPMSSDSGSISLTVCSIRTAKRGSRRDRLKVPGLIPCPVIRSRRHVDSCEVGRRQAPPPAHPRRQGMQPRLRVQWRDGSKDLHGFFCGWSPEETKRSMRALNDRFGVNFRPLEFSLDGMREQGPPASGVSENCFGMVRDRRSGKTPMGFINHAKKNCATLP